MFVNSRKYYTGCSSRSGIFVHPGSRIPGAIIAHKALGTGFGSATLLYIRIIRIVTSAHKGVDKCHHKQFGCISFYFSNHKCYLFLPLPLGTQNCQLARYVIHLEKVKSWKMVSLGNNVPRENAIILKFFHLGKVDETDRILN